MEAAQLKFARGCKIALLVWLLGVFIPLNLGWQNHTQYGAHRTWTLCFPNVDFSQYYLAGVAARYGLWEHLYPHFKPGWGNRLGREIWFSGCAEASPELLQKVPDLTGEHVLNIGPPPLALVCLPLAYFSFNMAFKIWMTGLILATVGTVFCAVTLYRRLGGNSGYVIGLIYLSGAFLPLLPRVGAGDNALMFLVLCVGLAARLWHGDRPFWLGTCLIIPAIFKGLTATWCPLLLFKPVKWSTLAWMTFWTLLLNGLVIFLGGLQPYKIWLQDILPAAQNLDIQQGWRHCMNLKGLAYRWGWENFPAGCLKVIYGVGLLAVYWGVWKQRDSRGRQALANSCAALVAALGLFNLCNIVSWLHYIALLLPFVGWAVVEYDQATPPTKRQLKILSGLLFVVIPIIHLGFVHFILRDASAKIAAGRDVYLGVELLFLFLAYNRLYRPPTVTLEGTSGATKATLAGKQIVAG